MYHIILSTLTVYTMINKYFVMFCLSIELSSEKPQYLAVGNGEVVVVRQDDRFDILEAGGKNGSKTSFNSGYFGLSVAETVSTGYTTEVSIHRAIERKQSQL